MLGCTAHDPWGGPPNTCCTVHHPWATNFPSVMGCTAVSLPWVMGCTVLCTETAWPMTLGILSGCMTHDPWGKNR